MRPAPPPTPALPSTHLPRTPSPLCHTRQADAQTWRDTVATLTSKLAETQNALATASGAAQVGPLAAVAKDLIAGIAGLQPLVRDA